MCSERAYPQEKRGTQFGSLPEDFKEEVLQLGFAGLNRSFTGNEEEKNISRQMFAQKHGNGCAL